MSTETKHRPGPWKTSHDHPRKSIIEIQRDCPAGEIYLPIATVYHDETGYDAKLIAAAPDLLAVLNDLLEGTEHIDPVNYPKQEYVNGFHIETIMRAKEIIKKATD